MTVTVIWLIAFAVILFLTWKGWEGGFGQFVERRIPRVLRSQDDRWVWCTAAAVVGATCIVKPVSMLLTVLLLLLAGWVMAKLVCWGMSKARLHK
ncbi:hypothetical protein [Modicisalibacter sp. 'Wilcox']|uniref:hypothetical protein n=1 Tax=Modicisalibacter sp. 'Wilcox' TaxID=2679914 RepID=UPI000791F588|nr:hypothetical protein [Modicisalibacter sp. 'Wilcox']KXS38392.1 MAG: hypothetical protein AWU55_1609 [Halomonadaceae bacterium T82-2]